MALDDPYREPSLEEQLYGAPPPSLADTAPAPDPWSWVPPSWNSDTSAAGDDEMRRQLAGPQQIGPSPDAPTVAPEQAPEPEFAPPEPEVPPAGPPEPLPEDAAAATSPPPEPAPEPVLAAPPESAPAPADVLATPPPPELSPAAPPLADVAAAAVVPPVAAEAPAAPALPPGVNPWAPQTAVPQIDAVSGGAAPAPPQLLPEQHYAQTVAEYSSHPLDIPDPAERQKYLNDLFERDPAGFAVLQMQAKDATEKAILARKQEIANKDYEQQIKNSEALIAADKISQEKSDALWADAQRLANTKIDPDGGLDGFSVVGGLLVGLIGGLFSGKSGSDSAAGAVNALNAAINRGIEAQKTELANKRESISMRKGLVAEEFARHGNMFRAQETVRLAALKRADDELATQQQNYAVGGTTELRIAGLRGGVQGQIDTSRRAIQRQDRDNYLKEYKVIQEDRQIDETRRQHRDENARGWASIAEQRAARAQAAQFKQDEKLTERADKEAERDRQFAIGAPGRIEIAPDGKPVVGPDGKPVIKYGDFINAPLPGEAVGKPWRIADAQERAKMTNQINVATELNQIYGRIRDLRVKSGGASAVFNDNDFQELEQLGARVLVLTKKGTEGMSSDEDMGWLGKVAGTKDITSFRDQAKRLEVAQARTNAALDNAMRTARYTGPPIQLAGSGPTTTNTPEEDKLQKLIEKPGSDRKVLGEEFRKELAARTKGMSIEERQAFGPDIGTDVTFNLDGSPVYPINASPQQREALDAVVQGFKSGISTEQRDGIARLGAAARGQGLDAEAARKALQKIVEEGQSSGLRAAAKSTLFEAASGGEFAAPPEIR